jgi:hypothetical protein
METGLSSNATHLLPCFRIALSAAMWGLLATGLAPLAAQVAPAETDAPAASTPPPAPPPPAPPAGVPPRVNLMVTVPRGEVDQSQMRQCRDDEDAGSISGEIVVCREVVDTGENSFSGDREAARKRYAEETALKGAPRAPDAFGIPDNGKGIGFGGVPPPAYMVDFEVLPQAPAGSDADRLARGLPALGQERELSEEEERARREAAGIKTTVPERPKKKGG